MAAAFRRRSAAHERQRLLEVQVIPPPAGRRPLVAGGQLVLYLTSRDRGSGFVVGKYEVLCASGRIRLWTTTLASPAHRKALPRDQWSCPPPANWNLRTTRFACSGYRQ